MGWSTHGSMLMSIPWMDAPMGASQDEKWGVEINGSIVGSAPWKREHPWVPRAEHRLEHQWWLHDGVHPMEEGAPMGASQGQKWGEEINGSIVGSVPWMGAPMGGRG